MKDVRSRRVVVCGDGTAAGVSRRYARHGYGIIQVPNLSPLGRASSDYFLTVTADEIQEFLRDKEEVVVLKGKKDRWVAALLRNLSERGVTVDTRSVT